MKPSNTPISHIEPESPHDLLESDASILEYNLSLSLEKRLENHQRALDLFNELLKARKELYGESESSPEAAP
jgi:hypothetical protein